MKFVLQSFIFHIIEANYQTTSKKEMKEIKELNKLLSKYVDDGFFPGIQWQINIDNNQRTTTGIKTHLTNVTSLVKDSPVLDQYPNIRYNKDAIYNNGGCNNISFLKDNKMCSNDNNDLTGINNFNYLKDVPPQGI